MYNDKQYQWTNITGATTTTVFTGSGTLGSVIVNAANAGGTITITDLGSPNVTLATISLTSSPFIGVDYNCSISGGLKIVTSNSPNITVTWAKG